MDSASLCSLAGGYEKLFDVPAARLHRLTESIPLNRFIGFLNVYKFVLSLAISNTTAYSEWQRPLSG
jgi:hypothetical protein